MAKRRKPALVADLVARFLSERQGHSQKRLEAKAMKVFGAFERIGPPITDYAEPALFRGGTLTLTVRESTWLTELSFLKAEVMERINRSLGKETVRDIRMRLGTMAPAMEREEKRDLGEEELAQVTSWAEAIDDPDVKSAMIRAAAASIAEGPPDGIMPSGPAGPRISGEKETEREEDAVSTLTYGYGDRHEDRWKSRKDKRPGGQDAQKGRKKRAEKDDPTKS